MGRLGQQFAPGADHECPSESGVIGGVLQQVDQEGQAARPTRRLQVGLALLPLPAFPVGGAAVEGARHGDEEEVGPAQAGDHRFLEEVAADEDAQPAELGLYGCHLVAPQQGRHLHVLAMSVAEDALAVQEDGGAVDALGRMLQEAEAQPGMVAAGQAGQGLHRRAGDRLGERPVLLVEEVAGEGALGQDHQVGPPGAEGLQEFLKTAQVEAGVAQFDLEGNQAEAHRIPRGWERVTPFSGGRKAHGGPFSPPAEAVPRR